MSADEMVELGVLREENRQLRRQLDAANRIICEQVADAASLIARCCSLKEEPGP